MPAATNYWFNTRVYARTVRRRVRCMTCCNVLEGEAGERIARRRAPRLSRCVRAWAQGVRAKQSR